MNDEMDLMEHLTELRSCVLYSFIAVVIGALAAYQFSLPIFDLISDPYFVAFPGHILIGTGPAEAFLTKLKVACFAGAILGSPILFYQLWRFVAPGLHQHEKRYVLPFIVSTTALFLGGLAFCYWVVLPFAFSFFQQQYSSVGITPTIRINEHLGIMMKSLLGFGLAFEFPLIAYFLGRLGLIDHTTLIAYFRHALVCIFLMAAVLTPPDVLTQFLMAGPLLLLYGLSIAVLKLTAN